MRELAGKNTMLTCVQAAPSPSLPLPVAGAEVALYALNRDVAYTEAHDRLVLARVLSAMLLLSLLRAAQRRGQQQQQAWCERHGSVQACALPGPADVRDNQA